ncbi:MAG: hypothetical protein JWO17_392 [Actinomycetia bacterium]|nr:hypothetical protein [Actinomycetes bacterium]
MNRLNSLSEALDLLVEPIEVNPDWETIAGQAARAGRRTSEPRLRRPSLRRALVLAAVVVAVVAAAAFATGLADRFSAWIGGAPGRPAPASEQKGFSARNGVALASFPAGTRLRILLRARVSGTSFDLLGFRNGDAYCLRLVRSKLPGAPGDNQCLRADELQGHVALIANNVYFSVGKPATTITGIYGFAADKVRAIRVTRARGTTSVGVTNNVFLALHGQLAGTFQHHLPPNPVLAVAAVLPGGALRNVPYVINGQGIFRGGKPPTVPSYFGPARASSIPGAPTRVSAPIDHPRISWLERRKKIGAPLPPQRYETFTFGRLIQPDPDDPIRIGIAVGPARGFTHSHAVTGTWVCQVYFQPLATSGGSTSCSPNVFQNGPMALGPGFDSPIVHLSGVAADGIVRVEAFLSTGRHVTAAIRDNVFSVAVPQAELGGELVGYNRSGQVAGIMPLWGNAVARPCPPAKFTTPVGQLPAAAKWEQVDLATRTVAGQTILGKTTDQVRAILGQPTLIRPRAQTVNSVSIPEYRYGGKTPATLGLSVTFVKKGDRILANDLYFQAPSLTDAKLGHVLRIQPEKLQQLIETTHGNRYRLYLGYGKDPSLGCTGAFHARSSAAGISFGVNPYRPSRPYIDIRANAQP